MNHAEGGGSPLPEDFLEMDQGPVCFSVELPGSLMLDMSSCLEAL